MSPMVRISPGALIGWGSGLSTHTVLGSPVPKVVDNIEIERAMYDGARLLLSVRGATPSPAWWGLARQAMELALQRDRQAGQIKALEQAERLQQALYSGNADQWSIAP